MKERKKGGSFRPGNDSMYFRVEFWINLGNSFEAGRVITAKTRKFPVSFPRKDPGVPWAGNARGELGGEEGKFLEKDAARNPFGITLQLAILEGRTWNSALVPRKITSSAAGR